MIVKGTERQKIAYALRQMGMTWQAVGDVMEVSRERARQLARAFEIANSGNIELGLMEPIKWRRPGWTKDKYGYVEKRNK